MKKVLHILSSSSFSGAENVACDIISNLSSEFEFAYCSPNGSISEHLKEKNIKYLSIKKMNIREIKRIIREYDPDIIHAHDFRASFIASLCKLDKKLIIHLHNNSPWLKKICLKSFIFLFTGLVADKILIVSNSIINEYIFSSRIEKKTTCIDNPISRKKILDQVDNMGKTKKYDICCVARITPQKNPYRFLKIIYELKKDIPDIKAIWVGDGELKEKVIEKAKKMSIATNIDFVGFKKNPYEYMNKAKIFLLTSDYEGYGLAAFEALSLGLPAVVSNVGGLVNIVDNKCGKLCDTDNIRNYVDIIIKLLNDNEMFKNYSKMAEKKSIQLDNLDTYIDKIKNEYS